MVGMETDVIKAALNTVKANCQRIGGYCYECDDNFTGGTCTDCVIGKFGKECDVNCSTNCYSSCNRNSGHCRSCKGNFDGDFCDDCKPGYYKSDCSFSCSGKCLDNRCNRQTGECEACQVGFFGADCSKQCSSQCLQNKCDQQSGKCNGCKVGKYGKICDADCSDGCLGRQCYQNNGLCSSGCQSGFNGDRCCSRGNCSICANNTDCLECDIGYYGIQCTISCPSSCVESICHIEEGVCLKGCQGGYEGPTCDKILRQTGNGSADIYAGVAVIVVIIVIIPVIVVLVRRKRRRQQKPASHRHDLNALPGQSNSNHGNGIINVQESELDQNFAVDDDVATTSGEISPVLDGDDVNEATDPETHEYYNTTTVIKVSDLYRFIAKTSTEDFQRDFKSLPSGLIKSYTVSQLPTNNSRNRYKGIYPYDHSRVTIPSDPTFYTNACFIDGYKKKQEFIASLGPTKVTSDDFKLFWKMVWYTRCEKIVMLTNLIENGVEKCEQYWPNHGQIETYGDVKVKCMAKEIYPEYTYRVLDISMKNESRAVHHLHFTVWPDKAVPADEVSLLEFRQKVRGVPTTLDGPTTVHCSAGIGRTGTYIAFDVLTEEAIDKGSVNVFGCVLELRQQRVNMVQTAKQYEFIHRCLTYMMDGGGEYLTSDDIHRLLQDKHGDKQITQMFQSLGNVLEDNQELKLSRDTNGRENAQNRKTADVPGDSWRPKLFLNRAFGDSNYINAVFINTFSRTDKIIIAQTPLPETVEDFLTLVYQTEVTCIVSLDDVAMRRGESVGKYLTEVNKTMTRGAFTVSCTGQKDYRHSRKTTMEIKLKTQTPRTVEHFQYNGWPRDSKTPEVASDFLTLVKDVQQMTRIEDKILVHCLNAGERSGMFCGVYNLLEKLQEEGSVNIVNTLRQIKLRRRNAVSHKKQIGVILQCLKLAADQGDATYYNM